MDWLLTWVSHYGCPALFGLLMFGIIGLPVPDETLLVFAGYLIFTGRLPPVYAFLAALGGTISGITVSYVFGRTLGHAVVIRYGRFFGLTQESLQKAHIWFERSGEWLLAGGYFIPGIRHFSALVAGTSDLAFPKFGLFAYSGALVWVSTFLGTGYLVGSNWEVAVAWIHRYTLAVVGAAAVASGIILFSKLRSR
jgi:membrane protein DedA with SNARE-associated domain